MAPGRRMTAENRRAHLLDAAADLAAGRDLATLSVQEIATHAGVSEGLLYHYFPTKQALLVAAVRRAADTMTAALDAAAHGPPLQMLAALMAAFLDHVQADPTGWRTLLQARTGELAEIAAECDQHSRRLALTGLGVASPSPTLSMTLNGWIEFEKGVCLSWLDHPDIPRAAVEDLLTSTLLTALESAGRHDGQVRELRRRLLGV